jgi:hypothetical protein
MIKELYLSSLTKKWTQNFVDINIYSTVNVDVNDSVNVDGRRRLYSNAVGFNTHSKLIVYDWSIFAAFCQKLRELFSLKGLIKKTGLAVCFKESKNQI